MASLKNLAGNRIIVLGKESREVVKAFYGLFSGVGIEMSSEYDLPLDSSPNNCNLVVLDSETQSLEKLNTLVTQGTNKTVVLNLEDLKLAKLSAEITHELFWLSSKDPVSLLGILLDGFKGAYWRDSELVVSRLKSFELFSIGPNSTLSTQEKTWILTSVLMARLCGIEEDQIQKKLDAVVLNETRTLRMNVTKARYTEAV